MFQVMTKSATQTQELAVELARILPMGSVIVLEGNLGSGKTTFTQGLGKALGVQRAIKSPTYTIVKEYSIPQGDFIHIDAYRLEEGGADSIDLPSYLRHDAIVMIEWAVYVADYLPSDYLIVRFTPGVTPDERAVEFDAVGNSSSRLLTDFAQKWSACHGS
ncbi:tRNA (adenosine(37)-N6)-threonylcarbamoyltransferase complex ATPase subunit type 1 TsaE [Aerococcaceae bacterium NML160702]|nr:tRNA (adenosine(37)-N6)-threonylcarbamoyltransferase complex ATPase subunit type 1 TsaE [Aerococcaceae bacterium NML190938]MCW6675114.1 tRNA (adenosine(37)-N6)-threonylcarbamoyltransferase complex ATPase subunit type 1 TsaE [Aerococcaceae bacterium NML171108]MCW6680485.1 tRNA (adenosine(37)-N6)-threonylcarbamoyltransferase complex ATPase subunit type 1 TsaE [Aerococcaceae bacterium NML130460]MCW6682878.1 tRNA (adenosine(37)-N6)-threonylcarbamoyltransferase complex ATPase subunit type 1 TsaE [